MNPDKLISRVRHGIAAILIAAGALVIFSPEYPRAGASARFPVQLPVFQTRRIEDIQLGQQVLASNPNRTDTHKPSNVSSDTWRKIAFEMDFEGTHYDLKFLRPIAWIDANMAYVGNQVHLELPHVGLDGMATVTGLEPCPDIDPPADPRHRIVTGTMAHESNALIDLHFMERVEPLVLTPSHKVWAANRGQFVPAADLQEGETMCSPRGQEFAISRIVRRETAPTMVFNLEVDGEHVFFVSDLGLLVHNDCLDVARDLLKERPNGVIMQMEPNLSPYVGDLPGYPVVGQPDFQMHQHFFHLENGILRDPAFPGGVPIDNWIDQFELGPHFGDVFRFTPYENW